MKLRPTSRIVSPAALLAVSLSVVPIGSLALGPGCASHPRQIIAGDKYPAATKRAKSVDIQVFRRDTEIEFTNTTAHIYGPSTIWLNGRFSHKIDGLAVGQTLKIRLKEFKDEFGDTFRGGGFFATELPERLALAEIQTGDEITGLVVIGAEE